MNDLASGFDTHSRSHSTVGTDIDEAAQGGPRGSFRGAPGFGSGGPGY